MEDSRAHGLAELILQKSDIIRAVYRINNPHQDYNCVLTKEKNVTHENTKGPKHPKQFEAERHHYADLSDAAEVP